MSLPGSCTSAGTVTRGLLVPDDERTTGAASRCRLQDLVSQVEEKKKGNLRALEEVEQGLRLVCDAMTRIKAFSDTHRFLKQMLTYCLEVWRHLVSCSLLLHYLYHFHLTLLVGLELSV